jgi:hypothetical protein
VETERREKEQTGGEKVGKRQRRSTKGKRQRKETDRRDKRPRYKGEGKRK